MSNKHPHYDTIVAWAEGKTIQVWSDERQDWYDWPFARTAPSFSHEGKFRTKPVTLRYRTYLHKTINGDLHYVWSVTEEANKQDPREEWPQFVRWLGDWQEVEI